jgi:DNA-binding MarR family transcriptional regulator
MSRSPRRRAPPRTVSRPELLVDGSDREFRRLVHGLLAFLARHEAIRAGHGARIGLAGIEYTVLIAIGHLAAEEGDVSVNRVAEHLHLSGAFVTIVTNKLLKRGLISKQPHPRDRRRVQLAVSEAGYTRLAELAPVQRQVNDVEFECLSAAEFRSLISMVERLIQSGDRAVRLQEFLAEPAPDPSARPRRQRAMA